MAVLDPGRNSAINRVLEVGSRVTRDGNEDDVRFEVVA